jgi:hypothetical protein
MGLLFPVFSNSAYEASGHSMLVGALMAIDEINSKEHDLLKHTVIE